MEKIQVALLGLGTVGKGVYRTLQKLNKRIEEKLGVSIEVTTILVKHPEKHRNFEGNHLITTDFQHILDNPEIKLVLEAIVGVEPAYSYLAKSIKAKKHVITANKAMFAHHGKELLALAEDYHVQVGFEATTAGGIPIIQTIRKLLHVNQIRQVTAILNGTSNYILTEMREKKIPFKQALYQAQQLGYAELDPTNDIEGFDAFFKLMILSELIFHEQPAWSNVDRIGIKDITLRELLEQQECGKRIKHLASLQLIDEQIRASIIPVSIPATHPLYSIEGVDNGIVLETDLVGRIILAGPGAGAFPTASAMLEDLAIILRSLHQSTITVSQELINSTT
ncbi:homoserine dehydrogenase [Ornithinibacillus bavariensis]|uniref:Homoserine dehydrogenase n=1 Tax=Ornithinibacillus bavariensis TaxID=545502 RepID=A0A919X8F8_9BACI|nr:homoserine dehydrogenase [Ornithinibacillus bavariensis]GIO26768.1 homoserine dehydrogenase [Ornithinibacillus bavariensis]HAM80783.1 homoserine dehydrogenase [Ornithinibacillus sp.]